LALLHFHRLCRRWDIDLIHLNETVLVPYVYFARLLGRPVVVHARTVLDTARPETRLLDLAARWNGVSVIAIDEEVRSSLPPASRRKAAIVYNPIKQQKPPSRETVHSLRSAWGFAPNDVVVGQVGSLHREKGVWEILALAEGMSCPRVRFVLVGDDSGEAGEGPQLRQAIRAKGLERRVILAGYRRDLSAVYGAFDISLCLFGKGLKGVGRTAFEAALAGRPVVVTLPGAGRSSATVAGELGIVLEPDDLAGIKEALMGLISSAERRREVGERARSTLGRRHDPQRVAGQVEQVYEGALAKVEWRHPHRDSGEAGTAGPQKEQTW
jgi:glycosyltransferase involved in cell wall biosynthesis